MSTPQFQNRFSQSDDGIVDLADVVFPDDQTVEVPASFYREVSDLHQQAKDLTIENQRLRETIRSMDLDCRAAAIDQQAARRELAVIFGKKLKKIRRAKR